MRIALLPCLLLAAPLLAQPADGPQARASDGGKVTVAPDRPLPPEADPVNRAAADSIEVLLLGLTIDGERITLDRALPARVPRTTVQKRDQDGDRVTVIAMRGGREIGRASVPDQYLNIAEGKGLVTFERRQISIAVPMDGAPDRLEVTAPATRARASLDPRSQLAGWCEAPERSRWCPRDVR